MCEVTTKSTNEAEADVSGEVRLFDFGSLHSVRHQLVHLIMVRKHLTSSPEERRRGSALSSPDRTLANALAPSVRRIFACVSDPRLEPATISHRFPQGFRSKLPLDRNLGTLPTLG